ncbi:alpha/beta fold hydrolase [Streptomyces sp. NPDC006265]|uniref:alpha/beta fold hydrolase n=1 Tax=Streptomyces sp. NPDC006265 TaxID=3156740 RepID=UPI0033B83CA0
MTHTTSGTLTTPDGTHLAYADHRPAGDPKVTFLLLHGLAGHQGEWDTLAAQLSADGHRVMTYDARGHGASTRTPATTTREAHVQDAVTLIEELGLAPTALHQPGCARIESRDARMGRSTSRSERRTVPFAETEAPALLVLVRLRLPRSFGGSAGPPSTASSCSRSRGSRTRWSRLRARRNLPRHPASPPAATPSMPALCCLGLRVTTEPTRNKVLSLA